MRKRKKSYKLVNLFQIKINNKWEKNPDDECDDLKKSCMIRKGNNGQQTTKENIN